MNQLRLIRSFSTKESNQSFEVLMTKEMNRLWSFALRLAGNEAKAEDLFQESVLKAFRAFGELKDISRFKPWIFQILYRQWVDAEREASRAPFVDLPLNEESCADPNPWDFFAWDSVAGKMSDVVQKEVDKLTPEFREVVWLKYVEDLDYREIAEVLQITEGTVASRLFRAKGLLKERLWAYAKAEGWVRNQ